ncbi:hypothetical protein CMI37_07975 [Candidatus Pacearchaeota archaeon]|nr:hypothetical protein [Candidatus Pacearchaeota archaeon]|tara:strand:- start:3103 stop:3624 length:522 start_codon:yes stop_codon:yes gene_type:complete
MAKRNERKAIESTKVTWNDPNGPGTFDLPTRVTKAMAALAARMFKAGSIGWAVAACAMRSEGVTIDETGVLSKLHGGNGHTRANVLRYGNLSTFTTVAMASVNGRSVKAFCVDMVALRAHLDKQDTKIAKQLARPKTDDRANARKAERRAKDKARRAATAGRKKAQQEAANAS